MIVQIIIGATGTVTKGLRKNLEVIPGKYSIDALQKIYIAILGTSHIMRKVLQFETGTVTGGDHRWFKRRTRERRPVTGDDNNNNNNNNNRRIRGAKQQQARAELGHSTGGGGGNLHALQYLWSPSMS